MHFFLLFGGIEITVQAVHKAVYELSIVDINREKGRLEDINKNQN